MATKKKKKKTVKAVGPKAPKRPTSFKEFKDTINTLKQSVYLIVRVRKITVDSKEQFKWITLGTGFFAAPNRFLTASHVINNPLAINEYGNHAEGDNYFLLKHDEDNNFYGKFLKEDSGLEIGKDIFLFPDVDLGVIYVDDKFYKNGDAIVIDKNDFIRISTDKYPIGSDIGILGYPLCELKFQNNDINKPLIGNVLLRTDKGVVNCRYQDNKNNVHYDFTLSFNPGNSGGPIFDIHTGRLVSVVGGYKAFPININEINIKKQLPELKVKEYGGESFIDVVHATYSTGFATTSFKKALKEHKVI